MEYQNEIKIDLEVLGMLVLYVASTSKSSFG